MLAVSCVTITCSNFRDWCMRRSRASLMTIISIAVILFFIYKSTCIDIGLPHSSTGYTSPFEYRHAVVVDAGSSGSRLFVYCVPSKSVTEGTIPQITLCIDSAGLPLTKKINPGLSSFANDPASAEPYIMGLMKFAATYIPKSLHNATPVYILATAGMRLLAER